MATAEELWAAAARSALAEEDAEEAVELEIVDDEAMEVEDPAPLGGYEGMTPEEEAEAARLVQAELDALAAEGEVELEAEPAAEDVVDEATVAVEAATAVEAEEPEEIDIEVEEEPKAPPPPAAAAPQVRPRQPAVEAPPGKGSGKAEKGKGKGKAEKGKGKGNAEGKGKGKGETFYGLVHQVGEKTGNMLVKSWKVSEKYGLEAMIPKLANPANAVLGDKISFEILERPDGARPLAVNVQVRGHVDLAAQANGPPSELRRQVLYYLSDDNLKTDKFFQDVIAKSEGGWIPMETILGCPRMKQMKATCENVFAAVRDAEGIELREEPAGEEAIRRTAPPPPLDASAGKGQAKGKAKGKPSEAKASEARAAPGAGPEDTLYYAGKVKSQMRMEPRKLFISCDEITECYGRDAYFLPKLKPEGVEVGSLVVFTVPPESEVGFSPQANFVARLAPLGSLGRSSAEEANGAAGASKGPGVQRTIQKKTSGW